MSSKRLRDDELEGYHFLLNDKTRKVIPKCNFPTNCNRDASNKNSLTTKHSSLQLGVHSRPKFKVRKRAARRDFPEHCGRGVCNAYSLEQHSPVHGVANITQEKMCSNVDNSKLSINVQSELGIITATPLRSVNPTHLAPMRMYDGESFTDEIENKEAALMFQLQKRVDVVGNQRKLNSYDHASPMQGNKISLQEDALLSHGVRLEPGVKSNELLRLDYFDSRPDKYISRSSNSGCREHLDERYNEVAARKPPQKPKKGTLMQMCTKVNYHSFADRSRDLINFIIERHDHPEAMKVIEVRNLYNERLRIRGAHAELQLIDELKREMKCYLPKVPFGHIPGISIGDSFQYRSELVVVGLHSQRISGIAYVELGGQKFATSIVDSGRYKNETKSGDVLIYLGQGGHSKVGDKTPDQKLEKGNLALANSKKMRYPIRVIYKSKSLKRTSTYKRTDNSEYIYDGLYMVCDYWEDYAENCTKVYKFKLCRLSDQPRAQRNNMCVW